MTSKKEADGPPFTVDRYGSFAECVIAERDWLRMAERQNVETVANFQRRIAELERTVESVADGLAGVRNASDEDAVEVLRAVLDGRVSQPPKEPPYRIRAFWSPCRKYIATACVSSEDVTLMDDDGRIWEPTGPEQDITPRDAPTKAAAPAYVGNPCICVERLALQANPDCPIHGMQPAVETPASQCSCPINECLDQHGKRCKDDL